MGDDLARRLHNWVDGYVQAWNSNDPAAIGALFSQDAAYHTEPYSAPWQGRDEIIRQWLDRKDAPGETEFRWQPIVIGADVAEPEPFEDAQGRRIGAQPVKEPQVLFAERPQGEVAVHARDRTAADSPCASAHANICS